MGIVTSRLLIKQFKYAVLIIFGISAILTPPDVVTQFMMAGPILFLYGISIIVARLFGKEAKKEEDTEEEEVDTDG